MYARTRAARLSSSNISACTFTGAIFCSAIPGCPWVRWNRPSGWSNCARSKTGIRIRVVETEYESLGVDTPADLERVSQLFEASLESDANAMAKYIFVTGGVVSSLGKGIAAASIGCLLESRGLRVTCRNSIPISTSIRAP